MLGLLLLASADPFVGEWRGTSICQVHPSPCHDEQAVYRIVRQGHGYQVHFAKLISGRPEEFGVVPGAIDPHHRQLVVIGHGRGGDFTWHLAVKGDTLTGTLTRPDGTVYRKAALRRVGH